jgi:hypothetical protein
MTEVDGIDILQTFLDSAPQPPPGLEARIAGRLSETGSGHKVGSLAQMWRMWNRRRSLVGVSVAAGLVALALVVIFAPLPSLHLGSGHPSATQPAPRPNPTASTSTTTTTQPARPAVLPAACRTPRVPTTGKSLPPIPTPGLSTFEQVPGLFQANFPSMYAGMAAKGISRFTVYYVPTAWWARGRNASIRYFERYVRAALSPATATFVKARYTWACLVAVQTIINAPRPSGKPPFIGAGFGADDIALNVEVAHPSTGCSPPAVGRIRKVFNRAFPGIPMQLTCGGIASIDPLIKKVLKP